MMRRNIRTGEFSAYRSARSARSSRRIASTGTRRSSCPATIRGSSTAPAIMCFAPSNRGDDLQMISPEISRTKRGTASALAESPRNPNVLYAGTDDGYLWVTHDGGGKWTNVADKVGLPGPRWVASIEPSRFADGRAYVAFDAHRSDDDAPYVYVTEDFGQTWKSLRGNLPMGSTRVLREDIENQNVLYLGTEFGVWVSIDRGGVWTKINNNLPTVAVHELAQHPTTGEMVAATHGRSLWIAGCDAAAADEDRRRSRPRRRCTSRRRRCAGGASRRAARPTAPAIIASSATIHRPGRRFITRWQEGRQGAAQDRRLRRPDGARVASEERADDGGVASADVGSGTPRWPKARARPRRAAPPGMYRVVLTVDGKEHTQGLRVENDPLLKSSSIIAEDEDDEEEREKRGGRIDD